MPYRDPAAKKANDDAYRARNRAILAAKQRAYYQRNREREDARNAAYFKAHPHLTAAVVFANGANQRAAEQGVGGKLWGRDVVKIGGPCRYCSGLAFGWDHVIPLCRGGPNVIENIVRCCVSCNKRKARRTPWEWQPDRWRPRDWPGEVQAVLGGRA